MWISTLYFGTAAGLIGMEILAVWHHRGALKGMSLASAGGWAMAAEFAWLASSLASGILAPESPVLDQFWLWTAILTLCPPIAVLGARRPTSAVWDWFIVVPLLAVLGWPGLTVLPTFPHLVPLKVQAPVFVGFLLVLLMGLGNYAGTRYGGAALLLGASVCLVLTPLAASVALSGTGATTLRGIAVLCFCGGVFQVLRQGRRTTVAASPYDRLWIDFRDTFGIVWAIRIQERLNATAQKERWACRLGPHGIEWDEQAAPAARHETIPRLEHALQWHLRRFVDNDWINRYLQPGPAAEHLS